MLTRPYFFLLVLCLHLISFRVFAAAQPKLCRIVLNTELGAQQWAESELAKINELLNFDPETRRIKTDYETWSEIAREIELKEPRAQKAQTQDNINRTFNFERTKARARALMFVRDLSEHEAGPYEAFKILVVERLKKLTNQIYSLNLTGDTAMQDAIYRVSQDMKSIVLQANGLKDDISQPDSILSPRAARALLKELDCSNTKCTVRIQNLKNSLKYNDQIMDRLFRDSSAFEMALSELLVLLKNPQTPQQHRLAGLFKDVLETHVGNFRHDMMTLTRLIAENKLELDKLHSSDIAWPILGKIQDTLDARQVENKNWLIELAAYIKFQLTGK